MNELQDVGYILIATFGIFFAVFVGFGGLNMVIYLIFEQIKKLIQK